MATPDLSAITSAFVEFGGSVFGKRVVNWHIRDQGIQVRTNVKAPQVLTKLSALGGPQPYRSQDDTTGNGVKYSDRTLIAYQSKWDYDFDPENYRNTYLSAGVKDMSYAQAAANQLAKEYLAKLLTGPMWNGVYNGAGTGVQDICTGWATIIAAEIVAGNLVPVATGAITNTNAVASFELMVSNAPAFMRDAEDSIIIYCSYANFDKYTLNYRTLNGFGFAQSVTGDYKLDNKNAIIRPVAWIPATSGRLILTLSQNLVFGTDVENITVAASMRRNVIEARPMMVAGCQIQDLDVMRVNDQA